MRKKALLILLFILTAGWVLTAYARPVYTPSPLPPWEQALEASLDRIIEAAPDGPQIGGVVGEWAVMAMAHAGRTDAACLWLSPWLTALTEDSPGALRRWTDYQRVALALDSLGLDAADFHGRDFTTPYRVFVPVSLRTAMNRTVTADIFALRVLGTTGRDGRWYAAHLLYLQRADGTWSLNPGQPTSVFDIDITAMAVQALSPRYLQGDRRVQQAVRGAVAWLATQSFENPESTAQALLAFTRLGEAYAEEAAYFAQKLLMWYDASLGGFVRPSQPERINVMATVQAAYALSVYRLSYPTA